jgi:hypothetical protein
VLLLWAVHNGGYDADTWYWGALLILALVAAVVAGYRPKWAAISQPARWAISALGGYVAWSYASIAWAQSPGSALQGSNRALLYLLVFALFAILPWTAETAVIALLTFVIGVGLIAIVLLLRLASADHVARLVIEGRLAAPTGYFNATSALFMLDALAAIALAARRELPGLLRGVLLATACAGLQLALIVQSRGWLFTLPLVAIVAILVVPNRLRVVAASALPIIGALAPLGRLLAVYQSSPGRALEHAATRAGHTALLICAAVLVLGTLIAWGETLTKPTQPSPARRRAIGTAVATAAVVAACVGAIVATHGHPFRFISRQWHGFSHVQTASSSGSHFADVGSGRYDFWRVSLDAAVANPIGGLGQDNFADYYTVRRHTSEEPSWTHSLEMRLLAHTGFVGLALFAVFLAAAIVAALRARRSQSRLTSGVAAAAMLPLVVWLIHGSVDWFWEIPALTGPALGFLAMAGALGEPAGGAAPVGQRRPGSGRAIRLKLRMPRAVTAASSAIALVAAAVVLGLPYLSVREVSSGSDQSVSNPPAALSALKTAADLNPLNADPGRLGGTIALQNGQFTEAEMRFRQAISREPGGWFSWLGDGLAASALGDTARAHHDFQMAESINSRQPAVTTALARVYSKTPLTPEQAFQMLVLAK